MHIFLVILMSVAILLALVAVTPTKNDVLKPSEHYAAKLRQRDLDPLEPYIPHEGEPYSVAADNRFWEAVAGARGLLELLRDGRTLKALVQAYVEEGVVSIDRGREVVSDYRKEVWYTFLSIPEAFICLVWQDLPHPLALLAVQYHWSIRLKTYGLCCVDGVPEDMYKDGNIL